MLVRLDYRDDEVVALPHGICDEHTADDLVRAMIPLSAGKVGLVTIDLRSLGGLPYDVTVAVSRVVGDLRRSGSSVVVVDSDGCWRYAPRPTEEPLAP
jgi:hypothetical protein